MATKELNHVKIGSQEASIDFVKSFTDLTAFKAWGKSVAAWGYTDDMLIKAWNEVNPAQAVAATPTPAKPATPPPSQN